MIVYEFYLKDVFKAQAFEVLTSAFYKIGPHIVRVADGGMVYPEVKSNGDPRPEAGQLVKGPAAYSVSRNQKTNWVQILVDDNASQATLIAIEARINGLKDDDPIRSYSDDTHTSTPMETPRHFSLDKVLRVRAKQKDGTLGRLEDA